MNTLIIFDLDGVITSEEAYWDAAGLTLHELLYSPHYWNITGENQYHPVTTAEESRRVSRSVFPTSEILFLKARAINSNWDTCYATVCLHLIDLLALLKQHLHAVPQHLLPLQPWDADWLATFRNQLADNHLHNLEEAQHAFSPVNDRFSSPTFNGYVGLELINRFDIYATELLAIPVNNVFSRYSPFWSFCRDIFQAWYLGDDLYTQTYGHAPSQPGKPGCIHFEQPLLPLEQEKATLQTLIEQDYILGFATGRVRQEADYPLNIYNLRNYFDDWHISTYDDVERAERELRVRGNQTLLSKPHPFPFLMAADPDYRQTIPENPIPTHKPFPFSPLSLPLPASNARKQFIVVGDSTSDILGGRSAGAITIAVLTGARTPEARKLLESSNSDFTIEDMTKLPALLAHLDSLTTIQKLQFSEREKAERLLQLWFARHMHLHVDSITLTPKAVSLNSFNGFYQHNNEEYFFKTHVEEQGILEEYYHAGLLHRSGYNIVLPLQTLHEKDQQMVIYPVIHWPVMFDLVRACETNDTGNVSDIPIETIIAAEKQECDRLLEIYAATLAFSTAQENARAPIHQLFWHRLTGGRFQTFYTGKQVPLPGEKSLQSLNSSIPFDELLHYRWIINGVQQQKTLGELVARAIDLLQPAQSTCSIIGHGDAHFGNIFLESMTGTQHVSPQYKNDSGESLADAGSRYLYFDPAFAGRHSPLLDITKPLFHNIFATWMYFPHDIAQNLHVSVTIVHKNIYIEHDYILTPVREAILQMKRQHLLAPLVAHLRSQNALSADWSEFMQLALMCCPLLTVNLLDAQRMPTAITWLGLAQAIQVGNSGIENF